MATSRQFALLGVLAPPASGYFRNSMTDGNCYFRKGQKLPHHLDIFATQWHCPDDLPHSINSVVSWNCYFRKGQKQFRHHLNIFATQWHYPDNLPHGIRAVTCSQALPLQIYFYDAWPSRTGRPSWPHGYKKAPKDSNEGQDETNEQLDLRDRPHILFPTLTPLRRQAYENSSAATLFTFMSPISLHDLLSTISKTTANPIELF